MQIFGDLRGGGYAIFQRVKTRCYIYIVPMEL